MVKFCTITPDRGDRPELLEFCRHQLSRMTVKPDHSYFIDFKPEDDRKDLVLRVNKGIEMARQDGFDKVFIVENDDFYPADYFEKMLQRESNFRGASSTICYNLRFNSYETLSHPGHSSLFHTAFNISALHNFMYPDDYSAFLDIRLWRFAIRTKSYELWEPIAISMKHNIGLVGGKGHRIDYKYKDPDRSHLKELVDSEAYAFYQTLKV